MSFEVVGKLHQKNDSKQVTASFQKREFVLALDGAYPQYVLFQLVQDKCDLLDPYNEGEEMKVFFDLRGREWTSPQGEVKYFNSLNAWKVEKNASSPAPEASAPDSMPGNFPAASDEQSAAGGDLDDLPF